MDPGILYLKGVDVIAAMPPIAVRLQLAERALTALVADAEMPPKIGVQPRPDGAFAHAMPAALRPVTDGSTTADDLLGVKWVTGFPANRAAGLPPINALVLVSDPATGLATAILDGGPITAQRTAAVSGVVVRRWAPEGVVGRARRAAIVGAGVQGHSHAEMLAHVLPGVVLTIHDRHPGRAAVLATAATMIPGIESAVAVESTASARDAIREADVVITAVTFAPPEDRQRMTPDWLAPDALVVAVDYAAMCSAATARDASLFMTDDRGQFLANRAVGQFNDYPDPTATIGEAILAGTPRPPRGRVVAVPLGIGLADIVFAADIVRRARALGLGVMLPR